MTKPLTIEMDGVEARRLERVAARLGETPEPFVTRVVTSSIEAVEADAFFARKGRISREEALAFLQERAARDGWPEPDPDDRLPEGYVRDG